MTNTPPNSSVPQLPPSTDQTDPRQAALHALATRPAPDAPPGPAGALTNRILVHTSRDGAQKLLTVLSPQANGLILRGSKASTGVWELHKNRFGGALIIDSESHTQAIATAEAPFVLPRDQLFKVTLEDLLQSQRDCGATVALTPTGYLRAGDSDALKAAADTVAASTVTMCCLASPLTSPG